MPKLWWRFIGSLRIEHTWLTAQQGAFIDTSRLFFFYIYLDCLKQQQHLGPVCAGSRRRRKSTGSTPKTWRSSSSPGAPMANHFLFSSCSSHFCSRSVSPAYFSFKPCFSSLIGSPISERVLSERIFFSTRSFFEGRLGAGSANADDDYHDTGTCSVDGRGLGTGGGTSLHYQTQRPPLLRSARGHSLSNGKLAAPLFLLLDSRLYSSLYTIDNRAAYPLLTQTNFLTRHLHQGAFIEIIIYQMNDPYRGSLTSSRADVAPSGLYMQ